MRNDATKYNVTTFVIDWAHSQNDSCLWASDINRSSGIILFMRQANERRRYIVTSSLIGWAHTQKDPWILQDPTVYCGMG